MNNKDKLTPEESADKDQRFQPNYEVECVNCGEKPTVDNYALCGVCFFGDSDCIYPENW